MGERILRLLRLPFHSFTNDVTGSESDAGIFLNGEGREQVLVGNMFTAASQRNRTYYPLAAPEVQQHEEDKAAPHKFRLDPAACTI